MSQFVNPSNLPLSLAVWLARDNYDYNDAPNHISATGLLKSVRQIVLSGRLKPGEQPTDISTLLASRLGTSIHDSIENAWSDNPGTTMRALGYPAGVAGRILVNPTSQQLADTPDAIPIYLEQRSEKEINGFLVSGKFDFIGDGRLEDFKSTGVFTYMNRTKDRDYQLQGSIYRWLNPHLITHDEMAIQFLFLDWSAIRARSEKDKGYPQARMLEHKIPLLSLAETERWIHTKTQLINQYQDSPESQLPECDARELWQADPEYRYYKDPSKTLADRSTKNFKSAQQANLHRAQQGVGIVRTKPGKVMACKYCPAAALCQQRDRLLNQGLLAT